MANGWSPVAARIDFSLVLVHANRSLIKTLPTGG
jgi:hypothetical protein